jgi:imidazoleglycerol-phosphate dehydratase
MSDRSAKVSRKTLETQISVELNLDGQGNSSFDTGIPFLEHMLEQIARHGSFDLAISATGDLDIDDHHTVEDIGITLGQAFKEALADKKGIMRYGHAYVPLDEALSRVVIDFSAFSIMHRRHYTSKTSPGKMHTTLRRPCLRLLVAHCALTFPKTIASRV